MTDYINGKGRWQIQGIVGLPALRRRYDYKYIFFNFTLLKIHIILGFYDLCSFELAQAELEHRRKTDHENVR